jgi:hypothetical protein
LDTQYVFHLMEKFRFKHFRSFKYLASCVREARKNPTYRDILVRLESHLERVYTFLLSFPVPNATKNLLIGSRVVSYAQTGGQSCRNKRAVWMRMHYKGLSQVE